MKRKEIDRIVNAKKGNQLELMLMDIIQRLEKLENRQSLF